MRHLMFSMTTFCAIAVVSAEEPMRTVTFARGDSGKLPGGWKAGKTGVGEGSVWKVVEDASAPSKSGYALAQIAASPNAMFNLCVIENSEFTDVEASVKFKAVKGEKDQGGGIVWRYVDSDNYYVARINPLEDNFRVYKVLNGKRSREFQNAEVKVPTGEWHALSIKMEGDHIECFLDGKKHLDVKDGAFTKSGKVGLWTKADAQTHFDEFKVRVIGK